MKYNRNKSFGYPVVRPNSKDYKKASFNPDVHIFDVDSGQKQGKIKCHFGINIKDIRELVGARKASFQLHMDCRDTFSRQTFNTFSKEDEFNFDTDNASGSVDISCYVIAETTITGFTCDDINPEFGEGPFNFETGFVLAQSQIERYYIIEDRFSSLNSLIRVQEDTKLKTGEWTFDVEMERPTIYANKDQRDIFLKKAGAAKPVIINTLILPMVAEMIRMIREDDNGSLDVYPWKDIILATLEEEGMSINTFKNDPYRLAQRFLGFPQRKLNPIIQGD